ncbi:MAG TPA: metal-dependent transcriptional regulator [Longimicrobiales bacterium]
MPLSRRRLSRSVEDYLKAIFTLCERADAATTSALAQLLEVQPASVTGMVKRLAESGLLEHVPYHGVRLTSRGTREALLVIRRHRIIETYLVERLDYSWDDVHGEAERLEHAASEGLIERMAAALEHPSHDPHGAPIPTRAGKIEVSELATLADVAPGADLFIRAVADEDAEGLRSLEARGMTLGVSLHVEGRAVDGVVSVRVGGPGGARQEVGHKLARHIYVAEAD